MATLTLPPHLQAQVDELISARDNQLDKRYLLPPDSIPQNPSRLIYTSNLLDERAQNILSHDTTSLAGEIAKGVYTAVEVVEAYFRAANIVHSATNCVVWLDGEAGLEQAEELDRYYQKNGRVVGPLHGIPISVKDFIHVRGFPQSGGHISSAGFVPDEDAHPVAILRAAGAVFMAKTSQPQSIMHLETSNFYGTTTCAYNRLLTSGGSSGGEGALVGGGGSLLGLTTDIGGSTRNPAANNGIWGFKPSSKRIPRKGITGSTTVPRIPGVLGPVARSRRDLELFFRVILQSKPWIRDITLLPLDWREVDSNGRGAGFDGWSGKDGKLRIGVLRDDGVVRPVKPIRRAMECAVAKLQQAKGIEAVEIEPRFVEQAWQITSALYWIDGAKKLREELGEEPMLPLTTFITSYAKDLSRDEVSELVLQRNDLRQRYFEYFTSLNLDVVLSPAGPAPAQKIGTSKYWNYTAFWNGLDWPSAIFPTGLQVTEEDADEQVPRNEDEKHLYETYDSHTSIDAPIGLQLSAPRWQDERLMAALSLVETILPLTE